MNHTIQFTFLTAGFPHGAYQSQDDNRPELRSPSIKGELRWWYDALFRDRRAEDLLLGGLNNPSPDPRGKSGPSSSKVIVRVRPVDGGHLQRVPFIPHKGQSGGTKNAISPGTRYEIRLQSRREELSSTETERLLRALDAWLLLGGIGQRANRAGGSVWPDGAPATEAALMERIQALLAGTSLRAALLPKVFEMHQEREMRHLAGDFLADEAFSECQTPFGSAKPRKPSPLKLRAVKLGQDLRLLAVFDGRHQRPDSLQRGIALLAQHKEVGRQLQQVAGALVA